MISIPTLETERLVLRPWRDEDIGPYAEAVSGERARFIGGPLSREDAWRKLAMYVGHWSLRGYGVWALEDKATNAFVGYSGPYYPLGWPEPEISWGLLGAHEGKGFATEAARRALQFAYQDCGWTTAISVIATGNEGSRRVAERLGAVPEGATEIRGMACGIWRHASPSQLKQKT